MPCISAKFEPYTGDGRKKTLMWILDMDVGSTEENCSERCWSYPMCSGYKFESAPDHTCYMYVDTNGQGTPNTPSHQRTQQQNIEFIQGKLQTYNEVLYLPTI